MNPIKRVIKSCVNGLLALAPFGYEIEYHRYAKAGGFPEYLKQASKVGMDVNDWTEQERGWKEALPILEQTTFPYLRDDSIVCELGVGTERWARHIAAKLPKGELYLVDYSPWIVDFVREYFKDNARVHVRLNDGCSLPFKNRDWVDVIFSDGTFIALKLGLFYSYSQEFFRVLKPGGHCIFDYIDITTPEGWSHLETYAAMSPMKGFTYHTPQVVNRVFSSAGFEIVKRHRVGKSTYVTFRKPARAN